jgi:hypothetical protein
LFFFASTFLSIASAEIKDYVYDGKEIYVHVKKDHLTTLIFPEPIVGMIRGFGADSYVAHRNDKVPNTLELMPTDSEVAEMTVSGISGEDYVLRCVVNDNFYTKLVIHRMASSADKNEDKTITAKMDIYPETVIDKKEPQKGPADLPLIKTMDPSSRDNAKQASDLPPELNEKITLKGNGLPLKIYLSTISQVTHYNVITTPRLILKSHRSMSRILKFGGR